ncbi:uncharacterized protein RSE6_07751 [Rhynchosporium secalis]|uniref:Uncharacterized protein n=1 Tax=Rhynchosporium secalis TaxID=38038 RepID=A0A1E1MER3_RHYSE|nr:uncharacterized protein RSE6_07751 [Rhynchosporium secalis]
MTGQKWQKEELSTLKWFVEKREVYCEGLAQKGKADAGVEGKWSWTYIAKKMQRVAGRDEWESNRQYDASNCELAWQTLQARTAEVEAARTNNIKVEPKEEFEINDETFSKIEHGSGDTVGPLPFESDTAIDIEASPEHAATLSRDASVATADNQHGPVQIRFENGLDHALEYRFDHTTNSYVVKPKATTPIDPSYFDSKEFIKDERASSQALNSAQDAARSIVDDSPWASAPFPNPNKRKAESEAPSQFSPEESPIRTNARWEEPELVALEWLVGKQKEEQQTNVGRRNFIWTWRTIAEKMNKVAARDGWDMGRVYNAGNCSGAWHTNATRVPEGRPSVSRRVKTPKKPASRPVGRPPQFPRAEQQGEPMVLDTINRPPPGPDAGGDQAPYHWLLAEREALHEVYTYSNIAENKLLTRGECRRRGRWTWTMVAREMNARSVGAPWYVGRVYDQSNCYNMIKYEKENFNLKDTQQPWGGDEEEKKEEEDEKK